MATAAAFAAAAVEEDTSQESSTQPTSSTQPPPTRQWPMRIDRVVGSHPELGPAAPEGGLAGWMTVAVDTALISSLPPLALAMGAVVVRDAANNAPAQALPPPEADSWDGAPLWVPALFCASWSFAAPWSRTVTTARGARVVCALGAALAASAQLAAALLARSASAEAFGLHALAAGVVAGAGCSLALCGAGRVLRLHFRRRLALAKSVAQSVGALAHAATPLGLLALLEASGGRPWKAQLLQAAMVASAGLLAALALRPPPHTPLTPGPRTPAAFGYELLQVPGIEGGRYDEDSDEELLPPTPTDSTLASSDDRSASRSISPPPKPLFSEVPLDGGASGADAVFVDENPEEEEEIVLYALDTSPKGAYRLREEVRAACRPLSYLALLLLSAVRLGNLAFWLLAPAAVRQRAPMLTDFKALRLVCACAALDAPLALVSPLLRQMQGKAMMQAMAAAFIAAALGCFGLGAGSSERSVSWLLLSGGMLRVGLSSAESMRKPLLLRAMGAERLAHARSLLDIASGLCVLLATLTICPEYGRVFRWLGWFQLSALLAAGVLHLMYMRRTRR